MKKLLAIILCAIFTLTLTAQEELSDYEKYKLEKEKQDHPYMYTELDTSITNKVKKETKDTVFVKQMTRVSVNNYVVNDYPDYTRRINLSFGFYDPYYSYWDPWYYSYNYWNPYWNWYTWDPWMYGYYGHHYHHNIWYPTNRYYSYYGPYYYGTYQTGNKRVKTQRPTTKDPRQYVTRTSDTYRSKTDRREVKSVVRKPSTTKYQRGEAYTPTYQRPEKVSYNRSNRSRSSSYNRPSSTSRSSSSYSRPSSTPSRSSYSRPSSTPSRSSYSRPSSAPSRSSSPRSSGSSGSRR